MVWLGLVYLVCLGKPLVYTPFTQHSLCADIHYRLTHTLQCLLHVCQTQKLTSSGHSVLVECYILNIGPIMCTFTLLSPAALDLADQLSAEGAEDELVCVASKSVKDDVLVKAHAIVGGRVLVAGGCGNKILQLLTGKADVTLFNLGTSLWDTCATEVLTASLRV